MSLLCRLGRHRPRGIPRWNDGLYFATCARCGRDLVRTAFEGWRVPSGYRIVWSDRPPASRPDVALVPEESGSAIPPSLPAAAPEPARSDDPAPAVASSPPEAAPGSTDPSPVPSPSSEPFRPAPETPVAPIVPDDAPAARTPVPDRGSNGARLPIQDVLAHLHAEEAANRAREAPPARADIPAEAAPSPVEPPARRRRPAWDFMDDDPLEADSAPDPEPAPAVAGVPAPGGAPAPASAPAAAAPPADVEVKPVSRKAGGLPERWRTVRLAVHDFFSGPGEPRPLLVTGLALAVAVAVALALYSVGYPVPGSSPRLPSPSAAPGGGGEGVGKGGVADPFAASAPNLSSPDNGAAAQEVAYVSASLLICREAPDDRAPRVRNLLRGREVRVLGYDGPWASLAYRGGQCWAQAQYLSPVPPL